MSDPTDPRHYQRLDELFRQACTAAPDERAGLLDRLCGEDRALRGELEAMLECDERPLSIFEQPLLRVLERLTGAPSRVSLRSESEPPPIVHAASDEKHALPRGRGHYQLLGEIAHGGMGVVLRGHDSDLGRDIALKVLHKDLMGRPEVLQRFVEEAQIGGQLQHPGIVPVYELGLMADQRPYFTMKLVQGRTLAALLAQRGPEDRRKLLGVFELVCQTLAYTHSRGVIHRDLKPANVMVGAFGEVQVVDWGLAKVLASGGTADEKRQKQAQSALPRIATVRSGDAGSGSHSQVGSVMGTTAYMAPEQARGEVERLDERTDVFALGAILCEILTGAPPYTGDSKTTLEQAAQGRLDDAYARLDACAADMELIQLCKQCLTPAQSSRPSSAEVLAQALLAYQSSVEERARSAQIEAARAQVKAREERKVTRLAIALAAVVLAAGAGWAWTQSAQREQRAAVERAVQAALEAGNLHKGSGDVQAALAEAEKASELGATRAIDDELAARVAAFLDESRRAVATEAEAREREARRAVFLRTLDRLRGLERKESYRRELALMTGNRGLPELGPGADESLPRSAAEARERGFATAFVDLGVDLAHQDDEQVTAALLLADVGEDAALALDSWARVQLDLDGQKPSRRTERLLALAKRSDPDPLREEIRAAIQAQDVAALARIARHETIADESPVTLHNLASALIAAKRVDEALALAGPAVDRHPSDPLLRDVLVTALGLTDPPRVAEAVEHAKALEALRPQSFRAVSQLGSALEEDKRYSEAERLYRRAIALDDESRAHFWLGWALQLQHRVEESIPCFQRAVQVAPDDYNGWLDLGNALGRLRRYDESDEALEQAELLAPDEVQVINAIGHFLHIRGDIDGALRYFERAAAVAPDDGQAHANVAALRNTKGDSAGAEHAARRAIDIGQLPAMAFAHDTLGNILRARGDIDGALAEYRLAQLAAPDEPSVYDNYARLLQELGEQEAAIRAWERAVELDPVDVRWRLSLAHGLLHAGDRERALEQYERIPLDALGDADLVNFGALLGDSGDIDRAGELYERALALNEHDAVGHCNLGRVYIEQGKLDDALTELTRAVDLDPGYALTMENLVALATRAHEAAWPELALAAQREIERFELDFTRLETRAAETLNHLGRYEDMERVCCILLETSPEDPLLLNWLGWALMRQGRHDDAEAVLRRAIPLDPDPAYTISGLAWVLATHPDESKRRPAEAAELAAQVMALAPDPSDLLLDCGVAFFRNGDLERAQLCLERSLEVHDGNAPVERCVLAMIHGRRGDVASAQDLLERARAWQPREDIPAGEVHFTADELRRFLSEAERELADLQRQ